KAAGALSHVSAILLGGGSLFFGLLLLLNVGAIVSLIMKRFWALATLGSLACLAAAIVSTAACTILFPMALSVGLATRDSVALTMAAAFAIMVVLLNFVGLGSYFSGMDASRLLRLYSSGPIVKPKD